MSPFVSTLCLWLEHKSKKLEIVDLDIMLRSQFVMSSFKIRMN